MACGKKKPKKKIKYTGVRYGNLREWSVLSLNPVLIINRQLYGK